MAVADCGRCREAWNAYMREYRSDPARRDSQWKSAKAGTRAAWRLVAEHRDEYQRYYAEELAALQGGV